MQKREFYTFHLKKMALKRAAFAHYDLKKQISKVKMDKLKLYMLSKHVFMINK
jgi:hypothetical protein